MRDLGYFLLPDDSPWVERIPWSEHERWEPRFTARLSRMRAQYRRKQRGWR